MTTERTIRDKARAAAQKAQADWMVGRAIPTAELFDAVADAVAVAVLEELEHEASMMSNMSGEWAYAVPLGYIQALLEVLRGRGARAQEPQMVKQCEQTIGVAGERIRCVFDDGHSGGHASGTKVWTTPEDSGTSLTEGDRASVSVPAPELPHDEEIIHAQQIICEAIERRFKELIPHALEHYACKLATQTLRRAIDQLMSLPPREPDMAGPRLNSDERKRWAEKFGVLSDRLLAMHKAVQDLDPVRQELHMLYSDVANELIDKVGYHDDQPLSEAGAATQSASQSSTLTIQHSFQPESGPPR